MNDNLFIEIEKFNNWAQSHFGKQQDKIGGEWECNYENWSDIYQSFEKFITTTNPNTLTDDQKNNLLYIIARDNETEYLASILNDAFLITLTEQSITNGKKDDKWQLAVQLYKVADKQKASELLEKLVNDDEEYVNRRALMELAKVNSEKTEFYAEKFWNKNRYPEREEYQKMAVLQALHTINSKLLGHYIDLAKKSGQHYLMGLAEKLQQEANE